MKVKRVLRFYFSADKLNAALDNLILKCAISPYSNVDKCTEKLCALVGEKQTLEEFWGYINSVMSRLAEKEVKTIERYALSRKGFKENELIEIKRCLIKFRRRALRIEGFGEAMRLIGYYYCLL